MTRSLFKENNPSHERRKMKARKRKVQAYIRHGLREGSQVVSRGIRDTKTKAFVGTEMTKNDQGEDSS